MGPKAFRIALCPHILLGARSKPNPRGRKSLTFRAESATHLHCDQVWSRQLCLRLFGKLPARVRRIFADGPCQFWRVRAEILLKDNVIGGDYKCHHAGQAILDKIGHEKNRPVVIEWGAAANRNSSLKL